MKYTLVAILFLAMILATQAMRISMKQEEIADPDAEPETEFEQNLEALLDNDDGSDE